MFKTIYKTLRPSQGNSLTAKERHQARVGSIIEEARVGLKGIDWQSFASLRIGDHLSPRPSQDGFEFVDQTEFDPAEHDVGRIIPASAGFYGGEQLFVRVTMPELELTHYFIADLSPTHLFGVRQAKLDVGALAMAVLCSCAKQLNDRVAFIPFMGDQVLPWLSAPGQGLAPDDIVHAAVSMIIRPPYASADVEGGLEKALAMLPPVPSHVLFFSDLLNLTDGPRQALKQAAGFHCIKMLVVQDYRERYLPELWPSWLPYKLAAFDLTTHKPAVWWCTPGFRRQYTRDFERHTKEIGAFLDDAGIGYVIVQTEHAVERMPYPTAQTRAQAVRARKIASVQEILDLIARK